MKNQWTTVSDSVQNTPQGTQTADKKESAKNRKIAFAMASTGVFLVLVGAAPFFFSGNNSTNYSAFLSPNSEGTGTETATEYDDSTGYVPAPEADFEDGNEIITEPVEVDVAIPQVDVEMDEEENILPVPETDFDNVDPIAEEVAPVIAADITDEVFPDPEVILDDGSDTIPASEINVITETNDFPINTHTGEVIDPIVLARTATADQLHGVAKENPETGLPLLPLLAFSAGAAILARRRKLV